VSPDDGVELHESCLNDVRRFSELSLEPRRAERALKRCGVQVVRRLADRRLRRIPDIDHQFPIVMSGRQGLETRRVDPANRDSSHVKGGPMVEEAQRPWCSLLQAPVGRRRLRWAR
jgi:hypothetical protein